MKKQFTPCITGLNRFALPQRFLFLFLLFDDRVDPQALLNDIRVIAVRREHQGDAAGGRRYGHAKGDNTDHRDQSSWGENSHHFRFLLLYSVARSGAPRCG